MNARVLKTTVGDGSGAGGGRNARKAWGSAELLCIALSGMMVWAMTAVGFTLANQPEPLVVNGQSQFVVLAGSPLPELPVEPDPASAQAEAKTAPTPEELFTPDRYSAPPAANASQAAPADATPTTSAPTTSAPATSAPMEPVPEAATPQAAPMAAAPEAAAPLIGSPSPSSSGSRSGSGYNAEPIVNYSRSGSDLSFNTEEYAAVDENGFLSVADSPLSTFSANVNTASYANLRRIINDGASREKIPSGAVRIEEMLNYFHYDFITPQPGEPFALNAQIADCPWNPDTKLMVLGIQAQLPATSAGNGANLVFLIDVSGSMSDPEKLPLLQKSFRVLVEQLTEKDRVSIVVYAGQSGLVLEGASGNEKTRILDAIDSLMPGGSTNGMSGMKLAYEQAEANFIEGGVNRIILASDGDLNVGVTSESGLKDYVAAKRQTGIYLSVLGFGKGNFKDTKMETIAHYGNGNYSYIDSLAEAHKVFEEDLMANMVTVADDVKLQVEFNPAYIKGYRQIGYETRQMAAEDFNDDTKDAAEMGAGHQSIVVYELVLNGSAQEVGTSELKYQQPLPGIENGEWMTLSLRYKDPGAPVSKGISYALRANAYTDFPDEDWVFVSSVIEFSMIAAHSDKLGSASLKDALERARQSSKGDPQRQEFANLISKLL